MRPSFLFVGSLLIGSVLAAGCDGSKKKADNQRQWDDSNRAMQIESDEIAARNNELKYQLIELEYDTSTAQLWAKCKNHPPSRAENQRACSDLMARIEKRDAAELAAAKKKDANW